MPVIHGDRLVALIDAKREGGTWRIVGYHGFEPVSGEAMRGAVHRLAAFAGSSRVGASARLPRDLRKALVGKIEAVVPPAG
jgi:hypothetical protein